MQPDCRPLNRKRKIHLNGVNVARRYFLFFTTPHTTFVSDRLRRRMSRDFGFTRYCTYALFSISPSTRKYVFTPQIVARVFSKILTQAITNKNFSSLKKQTPFMAASAYAVNRTVDKSIRYAKYDFCFRFKNIHI